MERRHVDLHAPAIGGSGVVLAYGHWGRPVVAFPTELGRAWEYESGGMVDAIAGLIEAGRLKLYCVDSYDAASWSNQTAPLEERARAHVRYEDWILEQVVPWIHADCGGAP
jgi:esterase/lipase superfamily enzyme